MNSFLKVYKNVSDQEMPVVVVLYFCREAVIFKISNPRERQR